MRITKEKIISSNGTLKKWVWSYLVLIFLLAISYGYCVNTTIANIMERQKAESHLSALTSEVSVLESNYIKINNEINTKVAFGLGFIEATNTKFVVRNVNPAGLSLVTYGN